MDGILFDPFFSTEVPYNAQELWRSVLPGLIHALRIGGAFMPYFAAKPELRWPYYLYFNRVIVERHPYAAYSETEYTPEKSGGRVHPVLCQDWLGVEFAMRSRAAIRT